MADDDDWRLQGQEKYLTGLTLRLRLWTIEREGWDHDHCEFCWKKIWDRAGGDDESERAYATDDSSSWICEQCTGDFAERFQWTLVT
jgi:ribosomal protein L37AE/L43A